MQKFKLAILTLILPILLIGCSGGESTQEVVNAVVVSKEYRPSSSYTTFVSTGKSVIPIFHTLPANNYVTVEYQGLTLKIDSHELYSNHENGDSIQILFIKKFDNEGQLKKQFLKKL